MPHPHDPLSIHAHTSTCHTHTALVYSRLHKRLLHPHLPIHAPTSANLYTLKGALVSHAHALICSRSHERLSIHAHRRSGCHTCTRTCLFTLTRALVTPAHALIFSLLRKRFSHRALIFSRPHESFSYGTSACLFTPTRAPVTPEGALDYSRPHEGLPHPHEHLFIHTHIIASRHP